MATATAKTVKGTKVNLDDCVNPDDIKAGISILAICGKVFKLIKTLSKQTIITVGAIIVIGAGFLYFNVGLQTQALDWAKAAVSSETKPLLINISSINGNFTKWGLFGLFGTPQLDFSSPEINGTITAIGKINMNLHVANGPKGSLEGIVSLKPSFRSNENGHYDFMGSGFSGSYDVISNNGQTTIEGMNISINLKLLK